MQDKTQVPALTVNTEPFPELPPVTTPLSPTKGEKLQGRRSLTDKLFGRKSISEAPSSAVDQSSPPVPPSAFASHDAQNASSTPSSPSKAAAREDKKLQEKLKKAQKKEEEEHKRPRPQSFTSPTPSPCASDEVQNSTTSPSDLKSALSSQDTQDKPVKRVSIAAADQSAAATSDAAAAGQASSKPVEGEPKPDKTPKRSIGQLMNDGVKAVNNGAKKLGRRLSSKSSKEPPAMPDDSVPAEESAPEEPAPEESPLSEYDLTNKSTLEEAFAAAFSVPLDHDAAQEKFTQAAADYYLTNATELYDDFRMHIKANLAKNAIHRTSSFCQVFLSVTGYIHIFTETDVAGMITREFADAAMGSKDPHRKFAEIVLSTEELCGFHNNGFVTKFNQLFSFRRAVVDQENIDRCYVRNRTQLQKIDQRRHGLAQVKSSRNNLRLEDGQARHSKLDMKAQQARMKTNELFAALRDT